MQRDPFGQPRQFLTDKDAVSELVGSLVMIGVTVATVAAFGLFLATLDGPSSELHVSLDSVVSPGADGWGTGDERISIRHLGGEDLLTEDTQILVRVDTESITFNANELGGGFSDGLLQIGESWEATITVPEGSEVTVLIIGQSGSAQHLVYRATPEVVA